MVFPSGSCVLVIFFFFIIAFASFSYETPWAVNVQSQRPNSSRPTHVNYKSNVGEFHINRKKNAKSAKVECSLPSLIAPAPPLFSLPPTSLLPATAASCEGSSAHLEPITTSPVKVMGPTACPNSPIRSLSLARLLVSREVRGLYVRYF